ncbi:hypothetical protein D3C72_2183200 [compost metagenome]
MPCTLPPLDVNSGSMYLLKVPLLRSSMPRPASINVLSMDNVPFKLKPLTSEFKLWSKVKSVVMREVVVV